MINFIKKLNKNILLTTILFAIAFFCARYLLSLFNLEYRRWIFYVFALIIIIGFILGIIQLIRKIKIKWLKIASMVSFIVLLIACIPFAYITLALSLQSKHVITKNGYKMIAYVNSWHGSSVSYYDYKNLFLHSKHKRLSEDYPWTNYLPVDEKGEFTHDAASFTWYDDDGNPIR